MKRIVALDPGGTTGWAMWQDVPLPQQSSLPGKRNFAVGHIGPEEHHGELWRFLETIATQDFLIVCESFEFRQDEKGGPRHGLNLMSREYIGVAKAFASEHKLRPVVLQTAGLAKGFIPDKPKGGLEANVKLKSIGLYSPGFKHGNDAMRHLVYYLVNRMRMTDLIQPWRNL